MSRSAPQQVKYQFAGLRYNQQVTILTRLNALPQLSGHPERDRYLMTQELDALGLWPAAEPLIGRASSGTPI